MTNDINLILFIWINPAVFDNVLLEAHEEDLVELHGGVEEVEGDVVHCQRVQRREVQLRHSTLHKWVELFKDATNH